MEPLVILFVRSYIYISVKKAQFCIFMNYRLHICQESKVLYFHELCVRTKTIANNVVPQLKA